MSRIYRRSPRGVSSVALLLALAMGAASVGVRAASFPAARIGAEEISLATVDAASPEQIQRIRNRLGQTARQAAEDLIDRRIGIETRSENFTRERAEIYRAHAVQLVLPEAEALETKLPPDRIVALVGDEPIHAAVLEEAAALRLYRLRGELYLQRRRNLDALIERHLLQFEASSRGVSLEELERLLSEPEPVSESELEEFASRERAAGRLVEDPERARPYLEFQKRYQRRSSLLEARRARTPIFIALLPPERPRLPLDTVGGVDLGAVTGEPLVVYTNYSCSLCRATHREIDRLLAGTRPPRVVLRDFVHDSVAMEASALVRCAAQAGGAAAARQLLLDKDPPDSGGSWFTAEDYPSIARSVGTTGPALRACVNSSEIRARIEQDTRAAQRLGFDDPPAFVAAGVPLSGMQTAELLQAALEGRLELLGD